MNLRKKFFTTAAAIAITASTALTGAAQVRDNSSVTIQPGGFNVSLTATNFTNLPYSLEDQTATGGSIVINVNDLTGDGGGWEVTLHISDFVGQSKPEQIIDVENLVVVDDSITITPVALGSQPIDQALWTINYQEVDADANTPQLVWSAPAGQGQGSYDLTIAAALEIPGRTEAQTYTATGTLNVVAGP